MDAADAQSRDAEAAAQGDAGPRSLDRCAGSVWSSCPAPTATPLPVSDMLSEVAFALPLTVQHVTADAAMLLFELVQPEPGLVRYYPIDQPAQAVQMPIDPGQAYQQVALGGLAPGVGYQAEVLLGPDADGVYHPVPYEGQAWGAVTFHTPSGTFPLRIGVIGDAGFGDTSTQQLVREMADQPLDFVIHTGDVVYSMGEDASAFDAYHRKWFDVFSPLLHTTYTTSFPLRTQRATVPAAPNSASSGCAVTTST